MSRLANSEVLLQGRDRANVVVAQAEEYLTAALAEANQLIATSTRAWRGALSPLPQEKGSMALLPPVATSRSASLLELAAACRLALSSGLKNTETFRLRAAQGVQLATTPAWSAITKLQERVRVIGEEHANSQHRLLGCASWMERSNLLKRVGFYGSPAFGIYILASSLSAHEAWSASVKAGGFATIGFALVSIVAYFTIKTAFRMAGNSHPDCARAEVAPYEAKSSRISSAANSVRAAVDGLDHTIRAVAAVDPNAPGRWTFDRWASWIDPNQFPSSGNAIIRLLRDWFAPRLEAPKPKAAENIRHACTALNGLLP